MCYVILNQNFEINCGICLDLINLKEYVNQINKPEGKRKRNNEEQPLLDDSVYTTPCGHSFHKKCLS